VLFYELIQIPMLIPVVKRDLEILNPTQEITGDTKDYQTKMQDS